MRHSLLEARDHVHVPEGTFYLLPKSPWADDRAFADLLLAHDFLVLPGTWTELPSYFRLSLTANDEMIERSLPGFAAAWAYAAAHIPAPAETRTSGDSRDSLAL